MYDGKLFYSSTVRKRNMSNEREHSFTNPIIHREIHGDKVYVPLNMERVWNN
jgi:hypothetical protein